MSDSDDDAAFASADEGEDTKPTTSKADKPKEAPSKNDTDTKGTDTSKGKEKGKLETAPTQQPKGATGKGKKKGKQAKKNVKSSAKDDTKTEDTKKSEKTETVEDKTLEQAKTGTVEPKTEEQVKTETPVKVDVKPSAPIESVKQEKKSSSDEPSQEDKKTDKPLDESSISEAVDKETLVKSPSGQNIQRESGTPDPKMALDQLVDEDEDEEEEENEQDNDEKSNSWGWGGWGSVVKVAQTSVSTFTNQVGEGFSTVMDTLENTLGAIPPEELATMSYAKPDEEEEEEEKTESEKAPVTEVTEQPHAREPEKDKKKEEKAEVTNEDKPEKTEEGKEETASGGGWFSSWGVSSIKDAVSKTTNISKNLVTGGIDVLETVGKKAFDFIEEHDPGIHRSKVLFERGDKPNLSHMLKEAKEDAEYEAEMEKESAEARKAHFGYLFDEFQGISHLEALEILSNQCEKRVQTLLTSLPAETLSSIKSELIQIKQIFEHEADDDDDDEEQEHEFVKVMTELLTDLHLGTTPDKINKVQEKIRKDITAFYEKQEEGEEVEAKTMHQKAIQSLAELTSKAMEQFHKAGELILIQKDSDKSFIERAKCLLSINKLLSTEVSILSTKFSKCLNKLAEDTEEDSSINQMVTNVYLEATNSSTYIHDGFQLLLPCLQQAAIENTPGITE